MADNSENEEDPGAAPAVETVDTDSVESPFEDDIEEEKPNKAVDQKPNGVPKQEPSEEDEVIGDLPKRKSKRASLKKAPSKRKSKRASMKKTALWISRFSAPSHTIAAPSTPPMQTIDIPSLSSSLNSIPKRLS